MLCTHTESVRRDAGVLKQLLDRTLDTILNDEWFVFLEPYQEPWRHYHNASHILSMFTTASETQIPFESWEDVTALRWMIVGHDWYYKVGGKRGDNETISAEKTRAMLVKNGWDRWFCRIVPMGIRCTIDHKVPNGVSGRHRLLIGTLLDLDLMGLGASPSAFTEDTQRIWLEYMPIVTREVFDAGRAAWARNFLKRDHIYHTSAFKHLESQARKNLETLARSA